MDKRRMDLKQTYVDSVLSRCSSWKMKKALLPDGREPAAVKSAKRIIAAFNAAQNKKATRIEQQYSRLYAAVRRELYFGKVEKALKMAEDLSRKCGE